MSDSISDFGKIFLHLMPLLLWLMTAGTAAGQVSAPTIGFATSATETSTGAAEITLDLAIPGGSFISALQFDVEFDNVALESFTAAAALDNFVVDHRAIANGATRVVAYAERGKLTPRTYSAVITLGIRTTSQGTVTISNVIGAEDSDFGQDANLQIGTARHELTLGLAGDANGDYLVDLTDVAHQIDAAFDASAPGADLYPWENADGQIDVRDVLILVRAVLADQWPDGSPLNVAAAGKNGSNPRSETMMSSSEMSRIDLKDGTLTLNSDVPVKVLMVTLHGAADSDFVVGAAFDGTVMTGTHRETGALRVMFYRMDGGSLSFEGVALGTVDGVVRHLEAEAVSADGRRMVVNAGITSVAAEASSELPQSALLTQNYPNPFNPTTQFELELPETQHVDVAVFNLFGQRVALLHNGVIAAGARSTFRLDGSNLPSGQYIYRVLGEDIDAVRTMTLLK